MNVIFLDIDGVLNHLGCKVLAPSRCYFVEDDKMKLLQELVSKTDSKIVLTSTWKRGWEDLNKNKETKDSIDFLALVEKFKEYDLQFYDYVKYSPSSSRGKQILNWVEEHLDEIDNMLVLDDSTAIQPFGYFFIQTSFAEGLKEKHIKKGVEKLFKNDFKDWYRKYKTKS